MKTVILIIMFGGQWQIAAVPAEQCDGLKAAIEQLSPKIEAKCLGADQ